MGCGDDDDSDGANSGDTATPAQGTVAPGNDGFPSPTATNEGETGAPALTATGFVVGDGQFDPHRTQVGTVLGQQALVYNRLLTYANQAENIIRPDVAMQMPEQPEEQTYVFRLNPAARWQDVSPLNGRRLTAEDVKYSFERQMSGEDAAAHRQARLSVIESIEAPSDDELVIRTSTPHAGFLSRIADPAAMIVPPEHQEGLEFSATSQPGSGPFLWVEWDEENFASVAQNPDYWGEQPRLGGVTVVQLDDASQVEASLRVKDVDVAFVGRPQANRLREAIPSLREQLIGNALFFGMRFYTPQAPFNDVRYRRALTYALDRENMIDVFFQGSGEMNPWISWPVTNWTLPADELADEPGYRGGESGREENLAEARQMLDAMEADGNDVPTTVKLLTEVTSEQQLSLGSIIARHLAEIGITVELEYVPINELVERHFAGDAAWIAGPDTGWLDLDDWVYPYFHSDGSQNSFALRDDDLDTMIEEQRIEFDAERRREMGYRIQRHLLAINAGVNLVSERVVALSWPYVRNFPLDITEGYQDRYASCEIDTSDPTYRPS
ncbi:MAG: ABC transporter substrate-binding protein [Dehalococcoidia bacterium]|nr:ABC transporter substrate-binding protein [Dehalococcoidia bacterium]